MIVIDASAVLAWAYRESNLHLAEPILRRIGIEGGIAPPIWPMEIANSLELSLLRGRISAEDLETLSTALRDLDIQIEEMLFSRVWGPVAALARKHTLTVYDAQYLEVALRLGLPLATFDEALTNAARAENVPVLP